HPCPSVYFRGRPLACPRGTLGVNRLKESAQTCPQASRGSELRGGDATYRSGLPCSSGARSTASVLSKATWPFAPTPTTCRCSITRFGARGESESDTFHFWG